MTEITRVPLQALAKGSMSKLWLGAIVAALAGAGLAAATMPPLVKVQTLKAGEGRSPNSEDLVMITYKGTLPDGQVFDQQQRAVMPMQGVVPGFAKAMAQTQKGGSYRFTIPAAQAYGEKGMGIIPPNTDLTFSIDVIDMVNRAQLEQQQRMMEQMMRARAARQGGAAGAAGADAGMPGADAAGAGAADAGAAQPQ